MREADFEDWQTTRLLQESVDTRWKNLFTLKEWGAYNLIKVTPFGARQTTVRGYITLLPAISGSTPRQMEDVLGLPVGKLAEGANLYRLKRVPGFDDFLPRGYTTLVDGLHLREGLTDSEGYRPGHGAFQVVLITDVAAEWITFLQPDEPFKPGLHPDVARLYGRT